MVGGGGVLAWLFVCCGYCCLLLFGLWFASHSILGRRVSPRYLYSLTLNTRSEDGYDYDVRELVLWAANSARGEKWGWGV